MGFLPFLQIFCFLTFYLTFGTTGLTLPPTQAIGDSASLTTVAFNASFSTPQELCTPSLIWTGNMDHTAAFTDNCFRAWKVFLLGDLKTYKGVAFEFLKQGVLPSFSSLPKMATPRRYIKSESTVRLERNITSLTMGRLGTCTLAIANIADIPKGILPNEPPGPFPRSDWADFSDFRSPMMAVRAGCLGRRKQLGWAVSGKSILSSLWRRQDCFFGRQLTLNRQATGNCRLDV